jgi:hypothetical protein
MKLSTGLGFASVAFSLCASGCSSGKAGLRTGADAGAADASVAAGDSAISTSGNGLVSLWRGEGNAFDSIGQNHGTLQGGLAFVAGRAGQAFEFNGTDTSVTVEHSTSLDVAQGITIAFWIRLHSLPTLAVNILRKVLAGVEDKGFGLGPDGSFSFYLFDVMNRASLASHTALTLDDWHYISTTYDGASVKIYVDGSLDASTPASGNIANGAGALVLGHTIGFFAGDLDEIRWYSRSLSEAEIASLASGSN